MRLSVIVIMLLALLGCGGPRAVLGLPVASSSGAEPRSIVPIYVATTRARSDNLSLPYSAERSKTLNFAKLEIGIPRNHVPGRVETSGRLPDPSRHFSARTYQPIAERQEFIRRLNTALAQRAPENREILIFVHGYNNNFADSVFRNAQITYDYDIKSVSLHYAWPSGASVPLYVFDRDSALVGRRGLAETIEIAAQTNATRVILVGHSMGAYVVTEALRDLALRGRTSTLKRLGGVVLAAPDIDVDVFLSQLDDIGEIPRPFTIIVSQRDRALGISRRLAGGRPRVGSGSDVAILQKRDIAVIDVSDIDGGRHNVFASSPTLMDIVSNNALMRSVLREDQGPVGQTMLADGASVIEGAATLVIFLPSRILGGLAQAAAGQ
ncbi:Esterase/lipase superfamily enzyme [Rhizobium tibeticum]|uniref:Esterase/lipase superfamily enzyme n=2 Tax=Rhizobium tibeticum TaxID=501024 RepID=A0A1H8PU11_9HYPH|nr:putative esterase of the alpha/beta hydrolase fold protein [Rhizobium tibeticum]SEO45187.1 Esterase/lipase superfamily enzyme [Rhizobium tibeticum]